MSSAVLLQWVSAVGGFGAVVTSVALPLTLRRLRAEIRKAETESDKAEAEVAQVLSSTSVALLAPAREEIAELVRRLRAALDRAAELEAEVQTLRGQVTAMSREITDLRQENAALKAS